MRDVLRQQPIGDGEGAGQINMQLNRKHGHKKGLMQGVHGEGCPGTQVAETAGDGGGCSSLSLPPFAS